MLRDVPRIFLRQKTDSRFLLPLVNKSNSKEHQNLDEIRWLLYTFRQIWAGL